jgi:large subunit ribosomal protein L10
LKLEQKKEIVKDLNERFSKAQIAIVTDYKGLNVESLTELRKRLREASVEYKVVKNTLLSRASKGTDAALLNDYFKGPCAIAISYDDPVAPAKILSDFAKDKEELEIKIGVMNGKLLSFEAIKSLSSLPSREVLLGQLLSVMNAVPTKFVRVLSAVPSGFMNVLEAIKKQKEASS